MSEASRGMEMTRLCVLSPAERTGLLLLFPLLAADRVKGGVAVEGVDQWTGCSQPRDKEHVEREPRTAGLREGPPLGAADS